MKPNTIDDAARLKQCMAKSGKNVEDMADAIGDSPLRLYRVLEGKEMLGKTAVLALDALKRQLPEIQAGD